MPFNVGDQVTVVEHDENTRTPLKDGRRLPARVEAVDGLYVHLSYDDKAVNGGRLDGFYASSGWRAWDGELRWRIEEA